MRSGQSGERDELGEEAPARQFVPVLRYGLLQDFRYAHGQVALVVLRLVDDRPGHDEDGRGLAGTDFRLWAAGLLKSI
jgi:hypothetical protein